MPLHHVALSPSAAALAPYLEAIRQEFKLPEDFSAAGLAELDAAIAAYQLPEADLTDVGFITIDPPESLDLDQAMFLSRHGEGYRVQYAIADVPAFVVPGGALDEQTRERGQTIYTPDRRVPLHPLKLSEDAASLLADQIRGAYVWDMELDSEGKLVSTQLGRAKVRSVAKLSYEQVQKELDGGDDVPYAPILALLAEIGAKRVEQERLRGGASLNSPAQEIESADGGYRLVFRPNLPVEDFNAQISLLAGMAAAHIMIQGKVGILRTMPEPEPSAIATFKNRAQALGAPWPAGMKYGEFLRTLDPAQPKHVALQHAATSLFRGAGYTAFDGEVPVEREQAAVAAPYAHTTAPLRRLVDRFVLVTCAALCADEQVPQWIHEALPLLPGLMKASDQLAGNVDRACLDLMEAAVLSASVGQKFEAVVVSTNAAQGKPATTASLQLRDPAVTASADVTGATIAAGDTVTAELVEADIASRKVRFALRQAQPQPADGEGNE